MSRCINHVYTPIVTAEAISSIWRTTRLNFRYRPRQAVRKIAVICMCLADSLYRKCFNGQRVPIICSVLYVGAVHLICFVILARLPASSSMDCKLNYQPLFSICVNASPYLWNQLSPLFRQPHPVHSPLSSPYLVHITSSQSLSPLSPSVTSSAFLSRLQILSSIVFLQGFICFRGFWTRTGLPDVCLF